MRDPAPILLTARLSKPVWWVGMEEEPCTPEGPCSGPGEFAAIRGPGVM